MIDNFYFMYSFVDMRVILIVQADYEDSCLKLDDLKSIIKFLLMPGIVVLFTGHMKLLMIIFL